MGDKIKITSINSNIRKIDNRSSQAFSATLTRVKQNGFYSQLILIIKD